MTSQEWCALITMELIKEYARRFHVPPAVAEKAMEYYRLAEMKCTAVRGTCLILVCIQLACRQLGEPFDKKQAQKLSGAQLKAYTNACRTVEEMLNIQSNQSLKDFAVKFGCMEAEELAGVILQNYKVAIDRRCAQGQHVDLSKSDFLLAAIYVACKALKFRCDKTQFESLCSKNVFQKLSKEMHTHLPKDLDKYKEGPVKESLKRQRDDPKSDSNPDGNTVALPAQLKRRRETLQDRVLCSPLSTHYLLWKERTIRNAEMKMKLYEK